MSEDDMKLMVLDKNADIIDKNMNKECNRVSIMAMLATISLENLIRRLNLGDLEEFSVKTNEGYLMIHTLGELQVQLYIQYGKDIRQRFIYREMFRPRTPRKPPDVIYAGSTPETPTYELPRQRINLKELIQELEDKYYSSKVKSSGSRDDNNKEILDALLSHFTKMHPYVKIVILMDKNANIIISNINKRMKEESNRGSILAMMTTLSLENLIDKLGLGEIDHFNVKTQRGYLMIFPIGAHRVFLIWIDDPSPKLGLILLDCTRLREKIERIKIAAYELPDEEFNLKELLQELEDKYYSYKVNSSGFKDD